MNRGGLQSAVVQQMIMAGNPNWWNINSMRPPPQQPSPLIPSSSFFPQFTPPSSSLPSWHDNQELPESWSQLLLGGLVGEEDRVGLNNQFQSKKLDNWEDQVLYPSPSVAAVDVKQEASENGYPHAHANEELKAVRRPWSQIMLASPPRSCVTSYSSNMLDFSNNKGDGKHQQPDQSPECNSTATGGAFKKARVQPSSSQTTFKVRKEKLGDRITALHQLVSPFGKTDTASVLLEAIGYIRFLQSQIEALSTPYLGSGSGNMRQQQSVQGERNCIFPEDPGQLLNDPCMKRRGVPEQDGESEPKKDLRSRGLCLVPVSCTLHVGNDNGADYWAPALGGGFR
ncbi:transcription factor bHLH68-like [Macadamia integrifolia]|uniref:transcription factor bHLH68-like n=1 Tax=Macadamia integrifolia TaxID=60698 RepID=UPI001C4F12BF|nr:transcription factor bHLH68-like [Macadamia integrifolia]